ncbi:MAG: YhcH/YjgK/YiaL family protein [Phycisphaeraceae bacterium]|nr:YhcH/YjgK/YiaL family protein [Phycisphaeraceae bacterium]
MIVDALNRANYLKSLGPNFEIALAFLNKPRLDELEDDRYDLHGKDVFAIVQTYNTRPIDQRKWEAHKKYLDIQYIISGNEYIGYTPLSEVAPLTEYDDEKDIYFFKGQPAHGCFVPMSAGRFMVLGPQDAHMPCVTQTVPEEVRKIVVKVAVEPTVYPK